MTTYTPTPLPPPPPGARPRVEEPSRPDPGLDRSDIPAPLPGRPLWVIFGSLLVIAALIGGTYQIITLLAHEEHRESYSVPAAEITTIDVQNDDGSVRITGTDGDEIRVSAEISRGLRDTGVSRQVVGSTLELRSTCPNYGSDWCRVTYRIEVPRRLDVVVGNENSSVTIVDIDGDVRVDADNGRVELVSIAGNVVVDTDNGRIEGRNLSGSALEANADNGRIELTFAAPPRLVTAESDNGSIDIALPPSDDDYDVVTNTDNGSSDVLVTDDPASVHDVRAETNNGSITIRPTG